MEAYTSTASHDDVTITRNLNFLARIPLYDTVKPYVFQTAPEDGFPATNVENEVAAVGIRSMRDHEMTYEKNGFCWRKVPTAMTRDDYEDSKRVEEIHIPELETYLKGFFNAAHVEIINYRQRRRHTAFPVATGDVYEHQQPAYRAHIDVTYETCNRAIRKFLGQKADTVMTGRWQYVNIWHPLNGPLYDWPLAICDISTISAADALPVDVLDDPKSDSTDDTDEELMLQYSPKHQWYYLPGQLPTELLIFKTADSQTEEGASSGTPHSAFDLDMPNKSSVLRESIELRALVCW